MEQPRQQLTTPTPLTISSGHWSVTVAPTGAALLDVHADGIALVGSALGEDTVGEFCGSVLAPWPNRLADGRYAFEGVEHRVPMNEPMRGCALHGLAFDRVWDVVRHTPTAIDLHIALGSDPGYPYAVDLRATYAVGADGLTAELVAHNAGSIAAPVGLSVHPYLLPGRLVDDLELKLPAETWIESDERLLPVAARSVADTPYDFRLGRTIGQVELDTAFTDLTRRGANGDVEVEVRTAGRTVTMWAGPTCSWFMVYNASTLPTPRTRHALALEPMTCGPNAMATGEDLTTLQPGASSSLRWGLRLT